MARIRTIKPDAFRSDSLSSVHRGIRWTFAGLWTYADDDGRGRDDVRLIKAELYPLDDDVSLSVLSEDLDQLVRIGGVCRYVVDGKKYLHMPNWEHQRINRPTPSRIPPCPIHEDSVKPHGTLTEDSRQERKGKEGKGTGKGRDSAPKRGTQLPESWSPNDHHRRIARDLELNLAWEIDQFADHYRSKGETRKDWDRSFNTWLRNSGKWRNDKRNPNGNVIDWDAAMARAEAREQ